MKFFSIASLLLYVFLFIKFCQSIPVQDVVIVENIIYVNDTRCSVNNSSNVIYVSLFNDTSKYIQCVSSGVGIVRNCLPGTGFNESQVSCVFSNVSVNANATSSRLNVSEVGSKRGFTAGQLTGVVCKNGGVINYHSPMGDCICLQQYSGHICEKNVECQHQHYAEILNGTFCVEEFIQNESLVRKDETHAGAVGLHLSNFTVHFQNVSANFEELLISLVDDVWSEISPEHAFLRDFNYSCIANMSEREIGSLAQKIKFYAKHVIKNFESNFYVYKDVLCSLQSHLVNRSNEVRSYAGKFVDEWNKNWINVENDTVSVGEIVEQGVVGQVLNTSQVIARMRDELNKTYVSACRLYSCVYNHTHDDHGKFVGYDSSRDLVNDIRGLFDQIQNSTCKNWNMVVDFGFWFLTNRLANDQSNVNQNVGRFAYNRKFWKRDEQNDLLYPVRNLRSAVSFNELFNPKSFKNSLVVTIYKMVSSSSSRI